MSMQATSPVALKFLEDRWDDQIATALDEPELLGYRFNLRGETSGSPTLAAIVFLASERLRCNLLPPISGDGGVLEASLR